MLWLLTCHLHVHFTHIYVPCLITFNAEPPSTVSFCAAFLSHWWFHARINTPCPNTQRQESLPITPNWIAFLWCIRVRYYTHSNFPFADIDMSYKRSAWHFRGWAGRPRQESWSGDSWSFNYGMRHSQSGTGGSAANRGGAILINRDV